MAQRQFRSDDTSAWQEKYGNGSDGAGSAGSNVQTTFSATSGSTSATFGSGSGFANGNLILIHQSRNGGGGVGNWELNKIASGGGTTSVTLAYATIRAYDTTTQVYLMKQYSSYNGTLAVGTSWDGSKGGLAGFFCNGNATITGGSSTGVGWRGGSGLNSTPGTQGEGSAGVGGQSSGENSGGGGGGVGDGGNRATGGGGGGHKDAGSQSAAAGGAPQPSGGAALGDNAGLTIAEFGGGGGGGARGGGVSGPGGNGGSGGGFILVIARSITVSGALSTNGNVGSNGSSEGSGGGGGAGGAILFKGQTIALGTAITATGGAGGSPASGNETAGGSGSDGRIHADYLTSISGTTSPTLDSRQDTSLVDNPGGGFMLFFV
jgi:hypothetical protein